MNQFALVIDGRLHEVVPEFAHVDGVDVPLIERFHPDLVAQMMPYDPAQWPDASEQDAPDATALRATRDALLAATDWTQLPDVPKETKAKFVPYRAALRDVPQQVGFPSDVKWPAAPQ